MEPWKGHALSLRALGSCVIAGIGLLDVGGLKDHMKIEYFESLK